MVDFYCEYGTDFILDPSGGIQAATGWDEARQFIIRLLLTNPQETLQDGTVVPAEYLWHPDFGLGLRVFLGQLAQPGVIEAIRNKAFQALLSNPVIAKTPPPIVTASIVAPFVLQLLTDVVLANGTQGSIAVEVSR